MTRSINILLLTAVLFFSIFSYLVLNKTKEKVDVTLIWQPSSEFENGDLLTAFEIERYLVQWADINGVVLGEALVAGNKNQLILKEIEVGTYLFSIKSFSVYGTESIQLEMIKRIDSISGIL